MITTLSFSFLYHKPQLCSYVIHIMTHLHLANDYWNLKFPKLYFEFLMFQVSQIFNYECFHMWMVGYHHFKKILNKISLIKGSLAWGFKNSKVLLLKPIQFIKLNIYFKFLNIHINHLAQISLINITLKWHYINMFDKLDKFFGHLTWFLACLTMIAPNNYIHL